MSYNPTTDPDKKPTDEIAIEPPSIGNEPSDDVADGEVAIEPPSIGS